MSIVTYNNRSISNITAVPGAAKSLTHIKTLTASSSSTLSFVNGSSDVVLDSTYPIYIFKFINIHPASDNSTFEVGFRDGSTDYDATKTTTFFWAYHDEADSETSLGYLASRDLAQGTGFTDLSGSVGNGGDESCSGELTLFNPSSTTFVKHFLSRSSLYEGGSYAMDVHTGGYCNVTAAIDAVQFKMSSGNVDAGTIKLYGLKDS
jgi:hypothetical protein